MYICRPSHGTHIVLELCITKGKEGKKKGSDLFGKGKKYDTVGERVWLIYNGSPEHLFWGSTPWLVYKETILVYILRPYLSLFSSPSLMEMFFPRLVGPIMPLERGYTRRGGESPLYRKERKWEHTKKIILSTDIQPPVYVTTSFGFHTS